MAQARLPRIFRVTGAVVLLVLASIVAAVMLIDALVRSGIGNTLLLAPWLLLVLWLVYVVGAASDVRADERGVQVQNLLRRVRMPWERVKKIAVRWQLEFLLDDGSVVTSMGGPARSRPRRLGAERERESENAESSDGLAQLQKLRLEALESATSGSDAAVQRSWDVPALIALGVLVVWAAAAVLIVQT